MPGINIKTISTYYRDRKRLPMGEHRFYSVLVPFVEVDGEVFLLFEKRAGGNIMAPSEICFPGGHIEPGESAGRAALRETEEELGIPMNNIKFLGRGDTMRGFAGFTLYTTIGQVKYDDYLAIKPELSEVAEAFLVSVSQFMEHPPYVYSSDVYADRSDFPYELAGIGEDYPWAKGKWETVIYNVIDREGNKRIVWGLTGGIVRHVMDQLLEATYEYR